MSKIDLMRIDAYSILVRAERMKLDDVPEKYREEVAVRVAEKTLEILGK